MSPSAAQTTDVPTRESQPTIEDKPLMQIWGEFHRDLWKFIRPRVASDAACDDLLQRAFLRAARAMEAGTEPEQPRAWLHQIARNLIIDSYRSDARRDAVESSFREQEMLDKWNISTADEASLADAVAKMLPQFVETLAEPYRTALTLVDLRGLSHIEAADLEKVSLTCMKARVRRGRKQLLRSLERCCTFELDGRGMPISCTPRTSTPCTSCG